MIHPEVDLLLAGDRSPKPWQNMSYNCRADSGSTIDAKLCTLIVAENLEKPLKSYRTGAYTLPGQEMWKHKCNSNTRICGRRHIPKPAVQRKQQVARPLIP